MEPGTACTAAEQAVLERPDWYHTMELAPGVVTSGWVDLRSWAPRALPERFDGQRVLEIGTFDGFWTFELERRGADVVTVDLASGTDVSFPPNTRSVLAAEAEAGAEAWRQGFRLAAPIVGSTARQVLGDVRTLRPADVEAPFDTAFVGTLLQHLPDPTAALETVHACLRPGGRLILMESFSVPLSVLHPRRPIAQWAPGHASSRYTWWVANLSCLRWWARSVGFIAEPWTRDVHRPVSTTRGKDHPLTVLTFQKPT